MTAFLFMWISRIAHLLRNSLLTANYLHLFLGLTSLPADI